MPSDFGAFAPVFETSHGYLALLNLAGDDPEARVRRVRDCCSAPSAAADVEMLIGEPDWRPNLVAVVAAFFLPPWSRNLDRFWKRLDSATWVSPQIAVGLSIIDPDFSAQCRVRLERFDRSAKAANALSWLAARIEPTPAWLPQILNSPEHLALIASDVDEGDLIAADWHGRITAILASLD